MSQRKNDIIIETEILNPNLWDKDPQPRLIKLAEK